MNKVPNSIVRSVLQEKVNEAQRVIDENSTELERLRKSGITSGYLIAGTELATAQLVRLKARLELQDMGLYQ
jgi:hypothetical protein